VIAFEADPTLASFCRERFSAEIAMGKLTIVEGAIIDRRKLTAGQTTVTFYQNPGHTVWGTISLDRAETHGLPVNPITVPIVNFLEVLKDYGVPYYLKVDLETVDRVCLEALAHVPSKPAYVSWETDGDPSVLGLLTSLGYTHFQLVEQGLLHMRQRVPTPAKEGRTIMHTFELGSSGLFGKELPGSWQSATAMRWQFRMVQLGAAIMGQEGWVTKLRGSWRLRSVPGLGGWYDAHARHGTAG
jgi:hypothetical protein